MSFNAGEVVANDDLDFDFADVGGPKGTVPEPTRDRLDAYWASVREGMEVAGLDQERMLEAEKLGGADTPEGRAALVAIMAEATPEKLSEMTRGRIQAIADLCAGQPSREEIDALPYRVQEAFFGWLLEKFRPRSSNAAVAS